MSMKPASPFGSMTTCFHGLSSCVSAGVAIINSNSATRFRASVILNPPLFSSAFFLGVLLGLFTWLFLRLLVPHDHRPNVRDQSRSWPGAFKSLPCAAPWLPILLLRVSQEARLYGRTCCHSGF